ncbi:MAG: prepilin peptidase [Patescibacteria group bacterium]
MIYFVLGILGLVMGSFVSAFVDRIHDGRDWVRGRSECDSCKTTLGSRDLIPLLSWLLNRGRCRHCKSKVSIQYPLLELTTAGLFITIYAFWPFELSGFEYSRLVFWLVTIVGFVALSLYDIKWLLLPNKILYPLIALTVAFITVEAAFFDGGTELVRDSVLGLLACGGVFYILFQVSSGKWIGGGDVKLGFLLGLLLADPYKSLLVILLSSIIGILIALPGLLLKKMGPKTQMPYGPALMLATVIVFLWGEQLINWYTSDILL